MLLIDGQKSELDFANFTNLDQVFVKVMEDGLLDERVVIDVLVNDEPFSEIYPHQAEDIEASELKSVEIRTMPVGEMAVEITRELYKVVTLMGEGASRVAELFRQADDAEALETYQDLVDVPMGWVTRHGREALILDLSHNELKDARSIIGFTTLTTLILDHNQITSHVKVSLSFFLSPFFF